MPHNSGAISIRKAGTILPYYKMPLNGGSYPNKKLAPNCQFKGRHIMMALYLTERWAQTLHTTRCLDTQDHNKDLLSIKTLDSPIMAEPCFKSRGEEWQQTAYQHKCYLQASKWL